MGFFGGGNYGKAGPGISKNERQKNGFFAFFEQYFKKFWKLLLLNIIYVIFCIPIITFGPATAAFTKVLRNYAIGRNAFLWSDFIKTFKENFNKAFVLGLIDLVFIAGFLVSIPTYQSMAVDNSFFYLPLIFTISTMMVFYMMHFYAYLMIVTTNLSLTNILKNSFKLTSIGLVPNLWTLLITAIVAFPIILLFPYSIFVLPFGVLSFLGLVICFNAFPVIRRVVFKPYYEAKGEEMPELSYVPENSTVKSSDSVFEDRGGQETPVNLSKKKGTGKVIK